MPGDRFKIQTGNQFFLRCQRETLVGENREDIVELRNAKGRFVLELIVRPIEFEMVLAILKNKIGATYIFGPNMYISKIISPQVPS